MSVTKFGDPSLGIMINGVEGMESMHELNCLDFLSLMLN